MSSSGKGQSLVHCKENLLDSWHLALENSRGKFVGVILEEFLEFGESRAF